MIKQGTMALSVAVLGAVTGSMPAWADSVTVTVHMLTKQGTGSTVGSVTLEDGRYGLMITPDLRGLEAGPHGLHVHEKPSCGAMKMGDKAMPGGGAGGHYDPAGTKKHAGPYGDGHLGDLPNIIVEHDGRAMIPTLAPRLKVADVRNRALMIHAGADRYAGHAHHHHHGQGGARAYCGVIR